MNISEAYFRIPTELSHGEKREMGSVILGLAEMAGQEFFASYGVRPVGEVVIEDGSSRIWARVLAAAAMLIGFTSKYGDIRSGLTYMWSDGKSAAHWMAKRMELALPEHPEVRRRRAPAAQRLQRLFERVEAGEINAAEASKKAEAILLDYGEDAGTVGTVVSQLQHEFALINPTKPVREELPPRLLREPRLSPIRRGKRLSITRDPQTSELRFFED